MYCVTNKKLNYLEKLPYYLGGVGKEEFNDKYIIPKKIDPSAAPIKLYLKPSII